MNSLADVLTRCDCCQKVGAAPPDNMNPYGLEALHYRAGTHGSFKHAMLSAIAGQPALRSLGTRSDDDLTIATIDAWALVLDVLTFYQERTANEVFLRTAQERMSLLEMARLIGYELRPGVAANVLLAFTLDSSDTSPVDVIIPERMRVQNIPVDDKPPQSFETSEEFLARPHWNLLHPRRASSHDLDSEQEEEGERGPLGTYYVKGVGSGLRVGDRLLLVTGETGENQELLRILAVATEPEMDRTRLEVGGGGAPEASSSSPELFNSLLDQKYVGDLTENLLMLNTAGVSHAVSALDASAWYSLSGASYSELASSLVAQVAQNKTAPDPGDAGLYVLRRSAAAFGHNAPGYTTILERWRTSIEDEGDGAFLNDWDANPPDVLTDSQGVEHADIVYLDQVYPDIVPSGWVVFVSGDSKQAYRIVSVGEESIADFAISGKSTVIQIDTTGGTEQLALSEFKFRNTAIYAASEILELADIPVERLEKDTEEFDLEEITTDLLPGHKIVLVGTRLDEYAGVIGAEEHELKDVLIGEHTRLILKQPLAYSYDNSTVEIYANVIEATHGETREEILGAGDAAQAMQRFKLPKAPLTHVPAATASGAQSTLDLKVGGVSWAEATSLYMLQPNDRNYILRRDDEGNSFAVFGDGRRGARLPTGQENITASYRWGIGADGMVDAGSISLLPVKPLGVKEVTNPLPSAGGEDPESRDDARKNAPLVVLTLDRIVSLKDFEDFARTFAGIGKARAEWVWDGQRRLAHVTVAGPDGSELSTTNLENLLAAIDTYGRPHVPRVVTKFEPLFFTLAAGVRINAAHIPDIVLDEVTAALEQYFSFSERSFAQRVANSEIQALIQGVDGIDSVDLEDVNYLTDAGGNEIDPYGLPVQGARFDAESGDVRAAQLLTMAPAGILLEDRS